MEKIKVTAKTTELAVAEAAKQLGVAERAVQFEVISAGKKGFLGFGAADAEIEAWAADSEVVVEKAAEEEVAPVALAPAKKEAPKAEAGEPVDAAQFAPAVELLSTILADFGIEGEVQIAECADENGAVYAELVGDGVELLIGHHGETLDALQYLCNLRLRHDDDESFKLKLDIANYRAKREATLCKLAERKAEQVLKYGRSVTLEPMNPYERRIIHARVQEIEGVTTVSTGTQNSRRVVIYPEGGKPELAPAPRRRRR